MCSSSLSRLQDTRIFTCGESNRGRSKFSEIKFYGSVLQKTSMGSDQVFSSINHESGRREENTWTSFQPPKVKLVHISVTDKCS